MSEKIVAEIITYNPDIEVLRKNICATMDQVECLLVYDNKSDNCRQIIDLIKVFDRNDKITLYCADANHGVASALAYGVNFALDHNYEFMLALDQDTIIGEQAVNVLAKTFDTDKKLAMVGCGGIADLHGDKHCDQNDENIKYCNVIITAGSLFKVAVANEIGNYNEDLFIDWVDNEYCYRILNGGYHIALNMNADMKHQLGDPEIKRFFGKKFYVLNYSPMRLYYIYRNARFCFKKYRKYISKRNKFIMFVKVPLSVLFYEKDKMKKIRAMIVGWRCGKKLINGIAIRFR